MRVGFTRGYVNPNIVERLAVFLIIISFITIINNYNKPIFVLISLELILISITLIFLNTSHTIDDIEGFLITIFLLVISAAEASIGLTLIMIYNVKLK